MDFLKSCQSLLILTSLLAPITASLTILPAKGQVQSSWEQLVSLEFPPAPDRGAPSRTAGGGSRGQCASLDLNTPLTALVPTNNVATTVAGNPTLFWYIPEAPVEAAELVIADNGEEIYKTTFALSDTPGIIQITLPMTNTPSGEELLEVGKQYDWYLTLMCRDPFTGELTTGDNSLFVSGMIERTELSEADKQQLAIAKANNDLKTQAEVYTQAGIWNEALATAIELRTTNPTVWNDLLTSESVRLDQLVPGHLADCCQADTVSHNP